MGVDGLACKKVPRLLDSLEPDMKRAYQEQRVLKAVIEKKDGTKSLAGVNFIYFLAMSCYYASFLLLYVLCTIILGVIVWDINNAERVIHFGPFSVLKEFNGQGVGRALVAAVEKIGQEKCANSIEIYVMNHRSDLVSLYEYWGFKDTGKRVEYPYPERLTRPSSFFVYYRPITITN